MPLEAYVAAIEAHPLARAVFVTSPSYNGFCADVPGLAAAAHAAGLPLVVDQAWGAHLRFSEALPLDAMAAGADAAVISVHKLLAGLSQASVVLATGDRLDVGATAHHGHDAAHHQPACADLPVDRRRPAADGRGRRGAVGRSPAPRRPRARPHRRHQWSHRARSRRGVAPGLGRLRPVRLTISAAAAGVTGYELERRLRADHAVAVEAADPHNIVANITFGDSEATVDRLVAALEAIAASALERLAGESGKRAAIAAAAEVAALHASRMQPA